MDSARQYYELIVDPMRGYQPSAFAFLSDDMWSKESNIIGYENISYNGINFTFNEQADRTLLADNNLYENMYAYILRSNLIIDNIDEAEGSQELKTLAKAEARTFRAFDHFLAVNTYAKAYDPQTAPRTAASAFLTTTTWRASPRKATVAQVYDFIIRELEESVGLLQEKPENIYHPNRAFGYGLLSQVYLFHRDWAKAQEAAEKSLSLNAELADYNVINDAGGMARYKDYAKDDNPEVLSYHWMAGWTTEEAALYYYGLISPELKQLFEPDDLRYSLFLRDTGTSIVNWFDSGSGAAIWTPAITNLDRFTYMSVGLRTAEVYLIMAEALARQDHLTEATRLREPPACQAHQGRTGRHRGARHTDGDDEHHHHRAPQGTALRLPPLLRPEAPEHRAGLPEDRHPHLPRGEHQREPSAAYLHPASRLTSLHHSVPPLCTGQEPEFDAEHGRVSEELKN